MTTTKTQPNLISSAELNKASTAISADTPLQATIGAFQKHMQDEGLSVHTVKAFASDLRLLGQFIGISAPVGQIATKDLNDFLYWLKYERGVPCSPKSYARRITTLKVFFGWLRTSDVLVIDPANAVIQESVSSPLPDIPSDSDIDKALAVTYKWRSEGHKGKLDARPHMLLLLLLSTGIKKSEAMAIVPNHIIDEKDGPYLFVRYKNPRLRSKERKIELDHSFMVVLGEYTEQYKPTDTLFTCTARNLEYILHDIAAEAGLERGMLSFENLRWKSALRDYASGVEPDTIRQRMGLSKVTWRDTRSKLKKLAEKQGIELDENS